MSDPILIHEDELKANPEFEKCISDIDSQYPPLGYERSLYPYYFILSDKSRYIRLIVEDSSKLVIPLFGVDEFMYQELLRYSEKIDHKLLMVDSYYDWIDSERTKLIPLGVSQDIDIDNFSLKGNKMRKLRYSISKFEKSGKVRIEEYNSESNLPLNEMRDLMINWMQSKKNIISHSLICMEELLQKKLPAVHRAFLTYHDNKLCCVIVIEEFKDRTYLMDLEFYDPESAPFGHMEYAIANIIEQLKTEGAKIFSLGLTWYPFPFKDHPENDSEGWAWLKKQNDKQTLLSKIFMQGKTNYQFKKKFGIVGEPVFAYLPKEASFSSLLNYWSVFYQNSLTSSQMAERLNAISLPDSNVEKKKGDKNYKKLSLSKDKRIKLLSDSNAEKKKGDKNHKKFSLSKDERIKLFEKSDKLEEIDYSASPLDLMTDSWLNIKSDFVKKRTDYLKIGHKQNSSKIFHTIFPFKHIIFTFQGKIAEKLFYDAFPKEKKKILTAIPWTTTLMHQLNNHFDVIEIPDQAVKNPASDELFKGEIDLEELKKLLQTETGNIAMTGVEVLSNASGGHPVRLSHLRLLKSILKKYEIPLVLDVSRVVRNAFLLKQYEDECKDLAVFDIVRQIFEHADYIVGSLTKDFAVPSGGLIATNDDLIYEKIKKSGYFQEQAATTDIENMFIQSLSESKTIINLIARQTAFTKRVSDMLIEAKVPLLQPAWGHAVVINVSHFEGETNEEKKRGFLNRMFIETGVRGSIHQVGKQKNTILDKCIRLAFPLGLTKKDKKNIYKRLQNFFVKTENFDNIRVTAKEKSTNILDVAKETGKIKSVTMPDKTKKAAKGNFKEILSSLPEERLQALFKTVDKRMLSESEQKKRIPRQYNIAIIGLSGRYPLADNHHEFWNKLRQGTNFIQEVPEDRWDHGKYYDPQVKGMPGVHKTCCKFGAFLKENDKFDASFFYMQPDEVYYMDPQERIALETSWSCIEDAGYSPDKLGKNVGVFSGLTYSEYQKLLPVTSHFYTLNSKIAYFFDFQGPTKTTDSGCASSLEAIELACQSLMQNKCRTAIVTGANLILHPDHYISVLSGLSRTAEPVSNPFGTDDGWIPAEGVVSVLLKPLKLAIEDKDHIYGVIKSAHIASQGKTAWLGALSPNQQTRLVQDNFEKSGIHPETISYVESAANGSSMGDTIEVHALTKAFGKFTDKKRFCPIGSVKSNIGHGEGVSTLQQLTKVLLQFKTETIVPLINLKEKNPNIRFDTSPFHLITSTCKWEPPAIKLENKTFAIPRRATISSFAAGGNMGHLILEEHVEDCIEKKTIESYFIPLSSKTKKQLEKTIERYLEFLKEYMAIDVKWKDNYTLLNIMFTLCVGRQTFEEKVVFITDDLVTLIEQFNQYLEKKDNAGIVTMPNAESVANTDIENCRKKVQSCLKNHSWHELARLWVNGMDISWEDFFDAYNVRRVSLPTYCFQKESFPIPKPIYPFAENEDRISESNVKNTVEVKQNKLRNTLPYANLRKKDPYGGQRVKNGSVQNVEKKILHLTSRIIEVSVDDLDPDARFSEFGIDSLSGIKLLDAINQEMGLSLEAPVIYDYSSIRDMSAYIARQYPESIIDISESEPFKSVPFSAKAAIERPSFPAADMKHNDVAVIGMSCRFADADNAQELWKNLVQGKNSIREVPKERWDSSIYYDPDPGAKDKTYSKWGGFIDDIDKFDPAFFNISPIEAEAMDPQQRIFLEESWNALEDAGYCRESLDKARCGVCAGVTGNDYANLYLDGDSSENFAHFMLGNAHSILSSRISYFLNLKGPALTIDTACSSSLAAVILACQSLINRESDMMLAGGISLYLSPMPFIMMSKAGMLSHTGKCAPFDNGADGIVVGEGAGVVVLKLLDQAVADGDRIYGVIKGFGMNQDGKTNGIAAPSAESQKMLELEIYEKFNIDPKTISYVEAHGTGTRLGDPIEFAALTRAFREYTSEKGFCAIGSAKSNIGHTSIAAGIAGLIKIILALEHKKIPPVINFEKENDGIDLEESPFYINTRLVEWKTDEKLPLRAALSSFGFSGTNCHMVIEEHVEKDTEAYKDRSAETNSHIFVLSAKNENSLKAYAKRMADFLKNADSSSDSYMAAADDSDEKFLLKNLKKDLLCSACDILNVKENDIDSDIDLAEYGFETLSFTAFCEQVSEKYKLEINSRILMEHSSIDLFSHYLIDAYKEKLAEYYPNSPRKTISEDKSKGLNLSDISYTLQVGRDAMEERLGMIADSIEELVCKLESYIGGKNHVEDLYQGNVKRNKEILSVLETDDDMAGTIDAWIAKGKYSKLLGLWVKGLSLDWNRMYGEIRPRRISLPTYPFQKQRYWVPEGIPSNRKVQIEKQMVLHPLVHRNTSDFSEQRFSSTFTGDEIFLSNQIVEGKNILPCVTCLEMVRAAVEQAAGISKNEPCMNIMLKNVVWSKPIAVEDDPINVHIGLYPEDSKEIAFEVYSNSGREDTDIVIHIQGIAALNGADAVPVLDIESLKKTCCRKIMNSDELCNAFTNRSLKYDNRQVEIERIYIGEGQALAKLKLPAFFSDTANEFMLHQALTDSTLQASGLMFGSDKPLLLPFALDRLEGFSRYTPSLWAFIRKDKKSTLENGVRLDIDICDENNRVCLRMKNLSSRMERCETEPPGTLMLKPSWREEAIGPKAIDGESSPTDYERHIVAMCGLDEVRYKNIEVALRGTEFIILESMEENAKETEKDETEKSRQFHAYALGLFEKIQEILKARPKGKTLFQVLISAKKDHRLFSGLAGLLKTARLENPKFTGQLIETDDYSQINTILGENGRYPDDIHIRYEDGKRLIADLEEIEPLRENTGIVWKDRGVYLITGGAGGLGLIFAEEIAAQVENPVLILTGRSKLDEDRNARLEELKNTGARVFYKQADVTKKKNVEKLINGFIEKEFGNLNGIIHSAGIIRDNFIIKKTKDEFEKVLAPKVAGLVNIDNAARDLQLDFFVIFSSGAGVIGNIGQADYACASAFMDAYAEYRTDLVKENKRKGKTLSIDWSLWKEGGMQVDEETVKVWMQSSGMIAMETETGIQVFYEGIFSNQSQVMTMEGNLASLRQFISGARSKNDTGRVKIEDLQIDPELLREKTEHNLKSLFREITKVPISDINFDEPFESYGIDSIMITMFNQKLDNIFEEVSKTLFYEYNTLRELTQYFISDHPQECMIWSGLDGKTISVPSSSKTSCTVLDSEDEFPKLTSFKRVKKTIRGNMGTIVNEPFEPIAIIGMSGRYAQAGNLEAYWENLKAGKDCITEIPKDRWTLEGFFHPDPDEAVAQSKSYCKYGSFVEGFANFDPLFFNISPKEAIDMDPQERLFIMSCWEVFEDAGYTKDRLKKELDGRVGVFAGITKTGFELYGPDLWKQGEKNHPHTSFGSLANRISYLFNLNGPSIPIDTMCSSSLTAVHEACEHLYRRECDMAVAGGVNLYLHPSSFVVLSALRMVTSDSKCKSFGKGGDGFLPGEGVGTVLLKPLGRAVEDRDNIYALIRGTGINHGGRTSGYTVPNPIAQGRLIQSVMKKAGVKANEISYIEAHGTGTELGDPIEITGLNHAFKKDTDETMFCAIGSAKSNIGHLEAASGIAGLTKTIMQMQHKKLVPSLHSEEINPNINFSRSPFVVQQDLADWNRPVIEIDGNKKKYPRIAGISSFGAGGVNAHVLIEEYIEKSTESKNTRIPDEAYIIVLSAKNGERLKAYAKKITDFLDTQARSEYKNLDLRDMAYTLQVGREEMEERLAFIVNSIEELYEKLKNFIVDEDDIEYFYQGNVRRDKDAMAAFEADDIHNMIDAWIGKKKYSKLLSFWVKGLAFDWNDLYGAVKPRRISLPTYPFAEERYWINAIKNDNSKDRSERIQKSTSKIEDQSETDSIGTLMIKPSWKERTIKAKVNSLSYEKHIIALCEPDETLRISVEDKIKGVQIIILESNRGKPNRENLEEIRVDKRFSGYALQLFENIQKIFKAKPKGKVLFQIVIPSKENHNVFSGLAGLIKTARLENPKFTGQLIETDETVLINDILEENGKCPEDIRIKYHDGRRFVETFMEMEIENETLSEQPDITWKDKGVYLITGGVGGLGLVFAKEIAARVKNPVLILSGRSEPGDESKIHIEKLKNTGAEVEYRKADVTRKSDVENLMESIVEEFGRLDGIIHSAGIICDNFIIKKTMEEFEKVIAPKVTGLTNLDEATRNLQLDFFVMFSSGAGAYGNTGQADYACANAFMDAYAGYRSGLVQAKRRSGKTLSIDWPLWKDGGMRIDKETEKMMLQSTGMVAMQTKSGIRALYQGISSDESQIMVAEGILELMKRRLTAVKPEKSIAPSDTGLKIDISLLLDKVEQMLVQNVSELLQIKSKDIDTQAELSEYGFDSITLTEFANKLNEKYKLELTPPLFFEYPAIDSLAEYLIENHKEIFAAQFPVTADSKNSAPVTQELSKITGMKKSHQHFTSELPASEHVKKWLKKYPECVPLNTKKNRKPCFWIHPLSGSVEPYSKIVGNLDIDVSFFGIRSRGFATDRAFLDNIEDMAKYYIEIITSIDPKGPYQLAGFSMGGTVAYEMARQLRTKGLRILNLILTEPIFAPGVVDYQVNSQDNPKIVLDPELILTSANFFLYSHLRKVLCSDYEKFRNIAFKKSDIVKLKEKDLLDTLAFKCREKGVDQPAELIKNTIENMSYAFVYNKRALETCKLTPVSHDDQADIYFFKGAESEIESSDLTDKFSEMSVGIEKLLGDELTYDEKHYQKWKKLLPGMKTVRLPTRGHFDLLSDKQGVKALIKECRLVYLKSFNQDHILKDGRNDESVLHSFQKKKRERSEIAISADSDNITDTLKKDIAIVGISGKFPMAADIEEFWNNVAQGKNCISEIPEGRWNLKAFYKNSTTEKNETVIRWAGFMEGVKDFDPLFFGISPREAELMDPQQRLLMLYVRKAIDDAGITPEALSQRPAGVFVSPGVNEYMHISNTPGTDSYAATGSALSVIPNRISYSLNLKGPSEYCETSCSSALVALHRAIASIHAGECEHAIIGAVNLLLSPAILIGAQSMGHLSRKKEVKSFQAEADGFIMSEGVGAVIIKPLWKAVNDNDQIYAVIKGTGVSHGGRGMSMGAPNGRGMKTAMAQAYRISGIDPQTVSYIEAHGTATSMGDAIEIDALKSGYKDIAKEHSHRHLHTESPCYISSLKPCIGHTGIASGMAALIKVVMALKEKMIPGLPGFENLNENIPLKGSRFEITAENRKWEALHDSDGKTLPRRAAVNSYGFGGVNAHMLIEEYVEELKIENENEKIKIGEAQVIVLSAKNEERLAAYAADMEKFLDSQSSTLNHRFSDIVYTLQTGREAMEHRLAMVVNNKEEMIEGLKMYLQSTEGVTESTASINVFTGNSEKDYQKTGSLFSGSIGDAVSQILLKEKNPEKLASYWVKGFEVPWEWLYEGKNVRKISLPTYPFEKRRCWIEDSDKTDLGKESAPAKKSVQASAHPARQTDSSGRREMSHIGREELVIDIISRISGMRPDEISLDKSLVQYGFDSICLIQLLQKLQAEANPRISLTGLQGCDTVKDIVHIVSPRIGERLEDRASNLVQGTSPVPDQCGTFRHIPPVLPNFPELIRLGNGDHGRPVFWFHGGMGSVISYSEVAHVSERPFYGIQARGYMTEGSLQNDIREMAAYYIDIIQSVQPKGPYDLGGYSIGGVIAYEVTRQLQEIGESISTIVMLDSLDSRVAASDNPDNRSIFLQAVNQVLRSEFKPDPKKKYDIYIRRDQINQNAEEKIFLEQLLSLAKMRGLKASGDQLHKTVLHTADTLRTMRESFRNYSILPLHDPHGVVCYYFRNKSGLLFGDSSPFHAISDEESSWADHTLYWKEWEEHMPCFHIKDVNSSSHMRLLDEVEAFEPILAFCKSLYSKYSKKGDTGNFVKTLTGTGQSALIPTHSDFPVNWENLEDENLLWVHDVTAFPGQLTPLDFYAHVRPIYEAANKSGAAVYGISSKTYCRYINTYFYYTVTELIPDDHSRKKLDAAAARLGDLWGNYWLPEIKEHLIFWESYDLGSASVFELLKHLDETQVKMFRAMEIHHELYLPVILAITLFKEMCEDLFEDAGQVWAYELISGSDNSFIRGERIIREMVSEAMLSPVISEILTENDATQVREELNKSAVGRTFVRKLEKFLQNYGRQSDKKLLSSSFWIEKPSSVIEILQAYLERSGKNSFPCTEKMAEKREKLLAEVYRQLKNYPEPVVKQFKILLKNARTAAMLREEHNFWIDSRMLFHQRQVFLEFGRRLAAAGVIYNMNDIFYLTPDEIRQSARKLPRVLSRKDLILTRRKAEKRFAVSTPPMLLGTPPTKLRPLPDDPLFRAYADVTGFNPSVVETKAVTEPESDRENQGAKKSSLQSKGLRDLRGHAGSPGIVRGKAKLVRTLSEAGKINPGDILVTVNTQPSWTTVFAEVAGIVTDSGGILSHCAVVAREYGIPAVVGTGTATDGIRNGQEIEVDGDRGVVRILSDSLR